MVERLSIQGCSPTNNGRDFSPWNLVDGCLGINSATGKATIQAAVENLLAGWNRASMDQRSPFADWKFKIHREIV